MSPVFLTRLGPLGSRKPSAPVVMRTPRCPIAYGESLQRRPNEPRPWSGRPLPGYLKPTGRWRYLYVSKASKSGTGRRLIFACSMPALALLLPFGLALGALLPQLPELLRSSRRRATRSSRILMSSPSCCPAKVAARCRSSSFKPRYTPARALNRGSLARARCNRGGCRNFPGRP